MCLVIEPFDACWFKLMANVLASSLDQADLGNDTYLKYSSSGETHPQSSLPQEAERFVLK